MAHRERYERTYRSKSAGQITKVGDTIAATIVDAAGAVTRLEAHNTVSDTQRAVDRIAGPPEGDWHRTLECPVCLHAGVEMTPGASTVVHVECSSCRPYDITQDQAEALYRAHDSPEGEQAIDGLADYLRRRDPEDERVVSKESLPLMIQEGRGRRRGSVVRKRPSNVPS